MVESWKINQFKRQPKLVSLGKPKLNYCSNNHPEFRLILAPPAPSGALYLGLCVLQGGTEVAHVSLDLANGRRFRGAEAAVIVLLTWCSLWFYIVFLWFYIVLYGLIWFYMVSLWFPMVPRVFFQQAADGPISSSWAWLIYLMKLTFWKWAQACSSGWIEEFQTSSKSSSGICLHLVG